VVCLAQRTRAKVWILTEASREVLMILLPEEY
jgi:hypothetical protein